MTDSNYTHIILILDRSGSMQEIKEATIAGTNQFIESQRKGPGRATLTLIGFDDKYEVWRDFEPIEKVAVLNEETYVPRGWTALYDAIGKAITETGQRLQNMSENNRPGKVLCVIQTDGQENHSTEYKANRIKEMITLQESKYGWAFVYLGANQDAFLVANQLGIRQGSTINFRASAMGMSASAGVTSDVATHFRTTGDASLKAAGHDNDKVLGDS